MDDSAEILAAMEQAAISGLCRDGQVEIGVQAARKLWPELGDSERLARVEALLARQES